MTLSFSVGAHSKLTKVLVHTARRASERSDSERTLTHTHAGPSTRTQRHTEIHQIFSLISKRKKKKWATAEHNSNDGRWSNFFMSSCKKLAWSWPDTKLRIKRNEKKSFAPPLLSEFLSERRDEATEARTRRTDCETTCRYCLLLRQKKISECGERAERRKWRILHGNFICRLSSSY